MTAEEAVRQALAAPDMNTTVVHVRRGSPVHAFVVALETIRKQNPGKQAVKMLVVDLGDGGPDFTVQVGAPG